MRQPGAAQPVLIRDSVDAYVACLSGAVLREDYLRMIAEAGFTDVTVTGERTFAPEDVVAEDVVAEFRKHANVTEAQLIEAAAEGEDAAGEGGQAAAHAAAGAELALIGRVRGMRSALDARGAPA